MTYDRFFSDALSRLHKEERYRVFAELERIAEPEKYQPSVGTYPIGYAHPSSREQQLA